MKSICSLMLIVLGIGLCGAAVFAQDDGVKDTCRIDPATWTIASDADSLFSFNVWGWSDVNIAATSLGFRITVDSTGFDPGRWSMYEVDFVQGVDVDNFYVSAMDSLIIFGDTTVFGPDISWPLGVRTYSQLDQTKWADGIEPSFQQDYSSNFFTASPIELFSPIMPANQPNILSTVTLLLRDPTAAPKNFTIMIDSSYFPPAGPFKFTPHGASGYAPEFVKGIITVSNLVLDADDEIEVDDPVLPKSYELAQNYPNPFNPSTTLKFYNAQMGHVSFTIYNIMGQRIRTLVDADMDIGWQEIIWDGVDSQGENVSSGLYFYRMEANDFAETKKMLLIK